LFFLTWMGEEKGAVGLEGGQVPERGKTVGKGQDSGKGVREWKGARW
jgi:hypothetical protein